MGTTIIISALTYMLLRSFEAFAKIILNWYREIKEDERRLELEEARRYRSDIH